MKVIQSPNLGVCITLPEGTETFLLERLQSESPVRIEAPVETQITIKDCDIGCRRTLLGHVLRRAPGWLRFKLHQFMFFTVSLPEGADSWLEIVRLDENIETLKLG